MGVDGDVGGVAGGDGVRMRLSCCRRRVDIEIEVYIETEFDMQISMVSYCSEQILFEIPLYLTFCLHSTQ